jgi:hypothetical protein
VLVLIIINDHSNPKQLVGCDRITIQSVVTSSVTIISSGLSRMKKKAGNSYIEELTCLNLEHC